MREIDGELHRRHRALGIVVFIPDLDRIAQVFHAHSINGDLPVVVLALGVGECHGDSFVIGVTRRLIAQCVNAWNG